LGAYPRSGEMMPSSTPKQARTMAAAAHNPKFAAKMGIPVKVAKEFNHADKGTHIMKGKKEKKDKEIGIPASASKEIKEKDAKMDKAHGVKEGSKEDIKQDRKLLKEEKGKDKKIYKKY